MSRSNLSDHSDPSIQHQQERTNDNDMPQADEGIETAMQSEHADDDVSKERSDEEDKSQEEWTSVETIIPTPQKSDAKKIIPIDTSDQADQFSVETVIQSPTLVKRSTPEKDFDVEIPEEDASYRGEDWVSVETISQRNVLKEDVGVEIPEYRSGQADWASVETVIQSPPKKVYGEDLPGWDSAETIIFYPPQKSMVSEEKVEEAENKAHLASDEPLIKDKQISLDFVSDSANKERIGASHEDPILKRRESIKVTIQQVPDSQDRPYPYSKRYSTLRGSSSTYLKRSTVYSSEYHLRRTLEPLVASEIFGPIIHQFRTSTSGSETRRSDVTTASMLPSADVGMDSFSTDRRRSTAVGSNKSESRSSKARPSSVLQEHFILGSEVTYNDRKGRIVILIICVFFWILSLCFYATKFWLMRRTPVIPRKQHINNELRSNF